MPTTCWSPIRGRAMRVTKLNACGEWSAGPKMMAVSEGFVSVQLSFQYEDGEQTRKKSANGELCVVDPGKPALAQIDAEINFCGVDPDLWNIISGNPLVVDRNGDATGLRIGERVDSNWALEVWTDVSGAACGEDDEVPYGYLLLPFLFGGKIGDLTVEEAAMDLTLSSSTKRNSLWGVGPYGVTYHDGTLPADPPVVGALLEAIGPKDHMHMDVVLVPPPTGACGAAALTPIAA